MKKFLPTAALLTFIATPALAQSFCTCDGTGNVLKFANNPITFQNQAPIRPANGRGGLDAFAMAPTYPGARPSADDPVAAGGGSVGYNENLRNY